MTQKEWTSNVSEMLANAVTTELDFYQRTTGRRVKEVKLCIASKPIQNAVISAKLRNNRRQVLYQIRFESQEENTHVTVYFYEEELSLANHENFLLLSLKKVDDYEEAIQAFLQSSIVY